ncbi:MAG: TusE/DsrC/DsvC family sulfur relay protein [Parasulfuritortus sp.]|nr:TusE/DsrC/DsvC family sulfur relay protein [Parasulfuritortus sp.]
MNNVTQDFVRPGYETPPIPDFPYAPSDWSRESAEESARAEGLTLTEEYWQVVRVLQEFYARHEEPTINVRELHDALDEHFHSEGGIKHLYTLFPKGPLAQGCLLAGLQPPGGTQDKGFGSAV